MVFIRGDDLEGSGGVIACTVCRKGRRKAKEKNRDQALPPPGHGFGRGEICLRIREAPVLSAVRRQDRLIDLFPGLVSGPERVARSSDCGGFTMIMQIKINEQDIPARALPAWRIYHQRTCTL
jgi:hypothetical protein